MLQACDISNAYLWYVYQEQLSKGILNQAWIQNPDMEIPYYDAFLIELLMSEDCVLTMGGSHLKTFGPPEPQRN